MGGSVERGQDRRARGGRRRELRVRVHRAGARQRPPHQGQHRPLHELDEPAATQVEPDTFAFGSTVVAVFQSGRFFDGGGSDIGSARSTDGGATWDVSSFLPGLTFNAGPFADPSSPFERVSDPSVAYDAEHDVWMVSSIPIRPNVTVPNVYVNRSTDGGQTFRNPVKVPAPAGGDLDKNWTACDDHRRSEFYGHCYTEFDDISVGGRVYMSTSTDGGKTWGTPVAPAGGVFGLGGQPVVQPGGAVIVPFESNSGQIASFRSTDGGASWSSQTSIAGIQFHRVAGNLRTSPLPSAETDRGRKIYVAWEDCRFEPSCSANDIVFSSSSDGLAWNAVKRIPIDPVGSGVDHFIPGLAVDPATRGSGTHLRSPITTTPTHRARRARASCAWDSSRRPTPAAAGARRPRSPARCRCPTSPIPPRARWSATTSRPPSTTPAPRRPRSRSASHTPASSGRAFWAPSAPLPVAAP